MKNLFGSAALSPRWAVARRERAIGILSVVALALALQVGERTGFAALSGGSAAGRPVASEVTTDWPGCGGVCGVRIETDYLVLDMSSAPAPSTTLRITLTLVLREATTEGGLSSFDVSSVFHAGQSGVQSVSGAAIPGGTGNVASAVLSWVDPATGMVGKEEIPLY